MKYPLGSLLVAIILSCFQLSAQEIKFKKIYNTKNILIKEGIYINHEMNGLWRFYDDSLGYLSKIEGFKLGFSDGLYATFNSKGIITSSGYYSIKAKKNHKEYFKDGYAYFTEPLPVGEWLYFDDNGNLIRRELYSKRGKLKKKEEFR